MGNELLLDDDEQFKNVSSWLPTNESLSFYDYTEKRKKKIKTCRWLWLQSSVNWNGSISPCCAVWHEKYDFGNIRDNSFKKIWNSKKYMEARNISKQKITEAADNICSICYSNKSII
jgi:radical SAM protein with 4Fe4S-binding SPASM domain